MLTIILLLATLSAQNPVLTEMNIKLSMLFQFCFALYFLRVFKHSLCFPPLVPYYVEMCLSMLFVVL